MWLSLSIKNLFRNLRRTLAIACTIALGCGALFAFDGFIHGVLGELKTNTIHSHYGFAQIYTKGYRNTVHASPMQYWMQDHRAIEAELLQMDSVSHVFPRVTLSAMLKSAHATVGGSGQGILAEKESEFFHSLNIETGEPLVNQPYGILLGKGLAQALAVKPGDTITVTANSNRGWLGKDQFTVTGIFHTGSREYDAKMFRIQLPVAQKLLKTQKIELMALGIHDEKAWPFIKERFEAAHPDLEVFSFDVLDQIYYQNSVNWLKAQYKVVLIIILSIVILGIFNSISNSILERKQEIGNLRANGHSRLQVLRLIMAENGVLSLFGGALGMGLAYILLMLFVHKGVFMPPGPGQTRQFLVTFSFGWSNVMLTLSLSWIAALIASFAAGIKVVRMSIVNALQSS